MLEEIAGFMRGRPKGRGWVINLIWFAIWNFTLVNCLSPLFSAFLWICGITGISLAAIGPAIYKILIRSHGS